MVPVALRLVMGVNATVWIDILDLDGNVAIGLLGEGEMAELKSGC